MRDYEEKSYYEIQLDNKQLILVFLAGVTVCVLVFVLGVMVGKGKKEAEMAAVPRTESSAKPSPDLTQPQEVQPVTEDATAKEKGNRKTKKERLMEEKKAAAQQKSEEPAYTELDKNDEETPLTPKAEPVRKTGKPTQETALTDLASKTQEPISTEPEPAAEPETAAPAGKDMRFTVQVMATASKDKAEQQLNYLKSKGYTAFMSDEKTGSGAGVYKVRVGRFADSDSAKKVATRLKQELKLETWVAVLE